MTPQPVRCRKAPQFSERGELQSQCLRHAGPYRGEFRLCLGARVGDLTLRYVYPEYTGLEPYEVVNSTGEARAVPGTRVEVSARSADPVEAAAIVAYEDASTDAEVIGERAQTEVDRTSIDFATAEPPRFTRKRNVRGKAEKSDRAADR